MIPVFLTRWLPPRGRRRERVSEPPSRGRWLYGHGIEDATYGPDAGPAAPAVHLPAVLRSSARDGSTGDVHRGAQDDDDTSAFYAGLKADRVTALDPDESAWQRALQAAADTIAAEAVAGRDRLRAELDSFAPGWPDAICERPGCHACVRDFTEAMDAAGVIVLPARPVDWSTAEWPALEVAG